MLTKRLAMQSKLLWINVWLLLLGCADQDSSSAQPVSPPTAASQPATVLSVSVSGEANNYQFSVEIMSPDTGCEQYADWWEVVTASGELIYRRILAHSHVDEQPFTRSGGRVAIAADQPVLVRVHMNNTGYSPRGMKGSANKGFETHTMDADFAKELSEAPPLPDDCNF